MNLADPDLALEKAKEFLAIVEADWNAYRRRYRDSDNVTAKLRGMLPLIRDIAERVQPEIVPDLAEPTEFTLDESGDPAWLWGTVNRAAETLVGVLEYRGVRQRILGPAGPVLEAKGLHEWVWDAAKSRWDDGYYGHAVQEAVHVVEQKTQVILGRRDLNGAALYREAFSTSEPKPKNPRLRLTFVVLEDKETWKSAHEGAMHLGEACAMGIRNPLAHGKADLNEQQALEQLAALSVLARWVEASERAIATPT